MNNFLKKIFGRKNPKTQTEQEIRKEEIRKRNEEDWYEKQIGLGGEVKYVFHPAEVHDLIREQAEKDWRAIDEAWGGRGLLPSKEEQRRHYSVMS